MRTARISADEAHALRREQLRRADDVLMKSTSAPASWNAARRSARFVMTSSAVDSYGDVIVTKGVGLTRFSQNPIGLLFHQSRAWPVGQWQNIIKTLVSTPPRMEGDLVFPAAGGPIPEIDQAAWAVENGLLRACSIGFLPDWSAIEKVLDASGAWTGGLRFNQTELLECSLCGVPANPDAMAKSGRSTVPPRPRPRAAEAQLKRHEIDRLKRYYERMAEIAALRRRCS